MADLTFDRPVRLLLAVGGGVDAAALRAGAEAAAASAGAEVEVIDLPRPRELPALVAMAERQARFDGYVVAGVTAEAAALAQTLALVGLQGACIGHALVATPEQATEAEGAAACLAALHLIAISRNWAGQTKGIGFRP